MNKASWESLAKKIEVRWGVCIHGRRIEDLLCINNPPTRLSHLFFFFLLRDVDITWSRQLKEVDTAVGMSIGFVYIGRSNL